MSSPQPAQPTPRKYQLFIDGQFVDAESGKTFISPNPATGETFAEVAEGDKSLDAASLGVESFEVLLKLGVVEPVEVIVGVKVPRVVVCD